MSTRSIVIDYDFPHPPERVWRALTDPSVIERWLMPNTFKPAVGHEFTFQAPAMHGWDGVVRCTVTVCDPPKRLAYSWVGGSREMLLDSIVIWTLTETPTGTRLHLYHGGFEERNAFAFDAMSKGWAEKVEARLREIIAAL